MYLIYDILASVVVGGILMMTLLSFNASVMEGAAVQTFNSIAQSNLTTLTDIVEHDFRKMGFRSPDSGIVYAGRQRLEFKADIDKNGSLDRIAYYIDATLPTKQPNPRVKVLVREVNGVKQQINLGVAEFSLTYFDTGDARITGKIVPRPSLIRSMRLNMTLESPAPYDTIYTGVAWERKIAPMNLATK